MSQPFSLKKPMILGLLSTAILVGGFGYWAATAEISGAVIASGQIQVDRNRQIVQHLDGGIVDEISVDEGDEVTEGQTLIRLDPALLQSQLTITEDQYYELVARRARLVAERDGKDEIVFDDALMDIAKERPELADVVQGQRNLFVATRASTEQEIAQLRKRAEQIADQITGIDAQQTALSEQLALIREELSNQQKLLEDGLTQASRVLSLQREAARLAGQVGELTAQRAQSEGRITEIDIQILRLENEMREAAISSLRDLQFRERELGEQARSLREQLSRLEIKAPVSGVVYDLQVFAPRSVIRPAEPVLYLVPQDRPLVFSVQVPPIHVDKVFRGQPVAVRFSALDQNTTPELFGIVDQISADAFQDEATGFSFYRAEVTLDEGEIDRLPEGSTLVPGMPVEAYIQTDERTPFAYLAKPFMDYFNKAFRES